MFGEEAGECGGMRIRMRGVRAPDGVERVHFGELLAGEGGRGARLGGRLRWQPG